MIAFEKETYEKLQRLDEIFDNMSLEELNELTEPHKIVDKLKGVTSQHKSVFVKLCADNFKYETDIINLRTELMNLKSDFMLLLKVMNKPQYDASTSAEFYTLKSKYGVY